MLKKLVHNNRSFRRFQQKPAPDLECLENLIALARLSPSAANLQPLRYVAVQDEKKREQVFACLTWAGYLPDWPGPLPEERPTAYLIILSDPEISKNPGIDVGLAAQTILLGARQLGFGGCLLSSIDRARLRSDLELPPNLEIQLTVALGTPGEEVRLTEVAEDGDIRYRRDAQGIHYVPKRALGELILKRF